MVTHNLRYAVEYGDRLLMMDKGKAVIDKSGEEKAKLKVEDLLKTFNEISVECGNWKNAQAARPDGIFRKSKRLTDNSLIFFYGENRKSETV